MDNKDDNENSQMTRIETRIDSIDVTLATNTTLLAEHIRRTNIIEEELTPVKNHVTLMNNLAKIITATGAIILFLKQLEII